MIHLRPASQADFEAYRNVFIREYSLDIQQSYHIDERTATEKASRELDMCFPKGADSDRHELLCIEARLTPNQPSTTKVGYLWHCANTIDGSTYLYDFIVLEDYRCLGFGRAALAALEQHVKSVGIERVNLRVAAHNPKAQKLYQSLGFEITGLDMSKRI